MKNLKFFLFFIAGFLVAAVIAHNSRLPKYTLGLPPQDVSLYATDATVKPVQETFRQKYFSPWTRTDEAGIEKMEAFLATLGDSPFYDGRGEKLPPAFYSEIKDNINLSAYSYSPIKGIVIKRTDLRFLPTFSPLYDAPSHPTFGFPFDKIAFSSLYPNTPVLILYTTKDGKFHLVDSYMGEAAWVEAEAVREVKKTEIKRFLNAKLMTPTKEPLFLPNGNRVYIGTMFPVWNGKPHYAAAIGWETVQNFHLVPYPLPFSEANVAATAQAMKSLYAWGGIAGFGRDCSQMLQDLFTAFGIHIPRNSKQQADALEGIDISDLTPAEKEKAIVEHGKPFETILYMIGHAMLYIGTDENGKPLVYHAIWGFKDYTLFLQETRRIIGRTIVSDLDIGKDGRFGTPLLERVKKILFTVN